MGPWIRNSQLEDASSSGEPKEPMDDAAAAAGSTSLSAAGLMNLEAGDAGFSDVSNTKVAASNSAEK